mmetsp:Transcript_18093/g.43497  ORF Transcript_18093/g.43497 Transcript_18093/m.43497 type:complete len:441 (-) Transcript_18093:30-1352(-)
MQTATGHACALRFKTSPSCHCSCDSCWPVTREAQLRAGRVDGKLECTKILEDKIREREDSSDILVPLDIAELYKQLGFLHRKYGKLDKAVERLRIALNIILLEFSTWREDVADIRYALGDLYHKQDMLDEALEEHKEALKIRCHLSVHVDDLAKSLSSVANVLKETGEDSLASRYHREMLEVLSEDSPLRHRLTLDWLASVAKVAKDEGDVRDLRQLLEQELPGMICFPAAAKEAILNALSGRVNSIMIWNPAAEKEPIVNVLCELANSYIRLGIRLDEAEVILDIATIVMYAELREVHFLVGRIFSSRSRLILLNGRGWASAMVESAMNIHRQTVGEDSPLLAYDLSFAGSIALQKKNFDWAATKFEGAASIYRSIVRERGPKANGLLGNELFKLAMCRESMGEIAGAVACLEECRDLSGISEDLSSECAAKLAELEGE